MNKDEIIKLIQDTVSKLTSNATSPHRHNGVDGLRIKSSDLLPYTFTPDVPALPLPDGTIFNYSFGSPAFDYGIYIYMGGNWNQISYFADGVGVSLLANQSIPDSTPTTILFDNVEFDDGGGYDALTGTFTTVTNGRYIISTQVSFDGAAGDVQLDLVQNGSVVASSYLADTTGRCTIWLTKVENLSFALPLSIRVTQTSGGAVDALAVDSFLSVKKFMN